LCDAGSGISLEAALAKLGMEAAEQGALQVNLSSDTLTSAQLDEVGRTIILFCIFDLVKIHYLKEQVRFFSPVIPS
jgi:hypothetical protein